MTRWRGRVWAAVLAILTAATMTARAADADATGNSTVAPAAPTASANGALAPGNANGAATAAGAGGASESEFELLVGFVNLPPDRLAKIIEALQKLQAMTPDERKALADRISAQMKIIREIRRSLAAELPALSARDRDVLRRYNFSLYPEDAQAWLDRVQAATTTDQRQAILKEMLTAAAARGIEPNTELSDKPGSGMGPGGRGFGRGPDGGPDRDRDRYELPMPAGGNATGNTTAPPATSTTPAAATSTTATGGQ
jgi:Trp operon repressor